MELRHTDEPKSILTMGFSAFEMGAPQGSYRPTVYGLWLNIWSREYDTILKKWIKTHLLAECYDMGDMSIRSNYSV